MLIFKIELISKLMWKVYVFCPSTSALYFHLSIFSTSPSYSSPVKLAETVTLSLFQKDLQTICPFLWLSLKQTVVEVG